MKRLVLAGVLSLAALPVLWAALWPDSQPTLIVQHSDIRPALASAGNVICVGRLACSDATTQNCSIAIGENVQFPGGLAGNHALVVEGQQDRKVYYIGPTLRERLEAETKRTMAADPIVGERIPPDFSWHRAAAHWNAVCGRMVRR